LIIDKKIKEEIFSDLYWPEYPIIPKEDEKPAAYIVILVNNRISSNANIDIGASASNMNIAAEEEGIGFCWIDKFNKGSIIKTLKLPAYYAIGLILALGYPAEI
jgi:hypothetical protein